MDDLTEEQARQMDAGMDLDVICAKWMGDPKSNQGIASYSRDWSAAGPLLEAMEQILVRRSNPESGILLNGPIPGGLHSPVPSGPDKGSSPKIKSSDWRTFLNIDRDDWPIKVEAPTPQLAIARACAVLVARGVSRDDLEDT